MNFEFLREQHPELADLGGFAEHYAQNDPASALVKLRLFGEQMVAIFFQHFRIPHIPQCSFLDYLQNDTFVSSVPKVVLDKFHAIRIHGNKAAHGSNDRLDASTALWILQEAFSLGQWLALALHHQEDVKTLEFRDPAAGETETKGKLKREKKAALQELASKEAQMQQLLERLEEARAQADQAEKTLAEKEEILAQASHSANALHFDEATTRKRLIDHLLAQAHWNVGDEEKVSEEFPVKYQPTDTGLGYADYVLWEANGKPLAVVEAKKTAHNAEKGRKQAQDYANGLEKMFGVRPVIFYTNGYDIFIWDDAKGDVPRKLYGFYSLDSLRYCIQKTAQRQKLSELGPKESIVDRQYQLEAIRRVTERFEGKGRKALLVLATGTGKTRIAIALSELLVRAQWVKRILFLCDRRELRKQANNAFAEHLDAEPRTYVTAATSNDRTRSIYLATYPAMMKCYANFDVGFFDLVIADESHRSIYNRYRDLFEYFDALQVGLTATPVGNINRNTYRIFDCEDRDPTANYSFQEAINDTPAYLVPFQVTSHTTKFLRDGIKYAEMTPEQQQQVDEQVEDPELIDFTKEQVSKAVFNKDTDRKILRNLMENGLREATDTHVGKTIIFARNHNHAIALQALFEEMYPQYMKPKKPFCAVIDNYVDRTEQLIDDFRGDGPNDNLYIAISVDMLDTGIDVPPVVNLVFAKPIKSYVKFWQMIGRGTRLCPNLFGPGQDKEFFRIFDHWGNFEYFGMNPPEVEPTPHKSLMQKIFEARLDLAEKALEKQDLPAFEMAVELLHADVNALPDGTIAVREKWRQVKTAQQDGAIKKFDAAIAGMLRMEIAPLMQWRSFESHDDAYQLDGHISRAQVARLKGSAEFDDFKDKVVELVTQLPINLQQVQAKIQWIDKVKSAAFWNNATVQQLDEARRELRGIMHCRNKPKVIKPGALELDVTDTDEKFKDEVVKLEGLDLAAYRQRVDSVLRSLFDEEPVLQKIKAGLPVNEEEIRPLIEKVMLKEPNLKVDDLLVHFPNQANRLDLAIRRIIGLDAEAVNQHFTTFTQKHPGLTAHQLRFLALIKQHIANYGALEIEKLYEAPFTQVHSEGVDGVFADEAEVQDLLALIEQINELTPVKNGGSPEAV